MKNVRMNIIIPIDLAEKINKAVGPRKRSKFLVEAAHEKLERMNLINALEKARGAWSDEDYPEFKTQDDISKWVRTLRESDRDRMKGNDIE